MSRISPLKEENACTHFCRSTASVDADVTSLTPFLAQNPGCGPEGTAAHREDVSAVRHDAGRCIILISMGSDIPPFGAQSNAMFAGKHG